MSSLDRRGNPDTEGTCNILRPHSKDIKRWDLNTGKFQTILESNHFIPSSRLLHKSGHHLLSIPDLLAAAIALCPRSKPSSGFPALVKQNPNPYSGLQSPARPAPTSPASSLHILLTLFHLVNWPFRAWKSPCSFSTGNLGIGFLQPGANILQLGALFLLPGAVFHQSAVPCPYVESDMLPLSHEVLALPLAQPEAPFAYPGAP